MKNNGKYYEPGSLTIFQRSSYRQTPERERWRSDNMAGSKFEGSYKAIS